MNDSSKYANKGLTGLKNIGNTCYLNSCMQILSHCYIFNDVLADKEFKNRLNNCIDSVLLIEWDDLHDLMWSKNCIISPNRYVNAVQKIATVKNRELFTGFIQNDFPEFLIFILECFHNALKHEVEMQIDGTAVTVTDTLAKKCYEAMKTMFSKEYSDIINIFYAIQVTTISSINDNRVLSIVPEPYCLLSLPINNNCNTLYDCLNLYCNNEILENDNAWYNDKTCKYETASKEIKFWSLPNVLIIDLKRFTNNSTKINKLIHVPLENLDLQTYINGYNKDTYIYNLFGICNHHGGCFGGHYTAYVKNANNNWYEFNDTNISLLNPNKIITNNAYCFFFFYK